MPLHPTPKDIRHRRGFWSRLRIYFRHFRAAVWTFVIILILALLWFNQVGLPGFLKRPLLEKLRARGIELQFSTLRLSWSRGFVAYDVRFGRAAAVADAPRFSARRIEVPLNSVALRRLDFEIGGLVIRDGLLKYPINETNQPARQLIATNLDAAINFLPADEWQIDNFSAHITGVKIAVNGELAHASALFPQKNSAPPPTTNRRDAHADATQSHEKLRAQLRRAAAALERIHFTQTPGLRASVFADARDLRASKIAVSLAAARTITPWGEFTDTRLTVRSAGFSRAATKPAPELTVARLQTRLDGGPLDLAARLDLATRELNFNGVSDFDLQKIHPLLTEKSARWLGQYSWEQPPHFTFSGSVTLPAWTNRLADWPPALAAALNLDGEFRLQHAAFRGVTALAAQSHFSYSNRAWRLPDLVLTRPEGVLRVEHWTDDATRDYYWRLRGAFDPGCLRPLFAPGGQHALDLARFTTAPEWDGEIRGRWQAHELTAARAAVAVSNFTFRGESIASLRTTAEYTNLFLHLLQPEITRAGGEHFHLDGVGLDFAGKFAHLTNGAGRIDPQAVARAIGPKTAQAIEPYQFLAPPLATVHGTVSIVTNTGADLHVTLDGGPFRWWKFNLTQLRGDVLWLDRALLITNLDGQFHGGRLTGATFFDFTTPSGSDFNFTTAFTNVNLATLMRDLAGNTNKMEGLIAGRLNVTRANSDDWKSWQGGGAVNLRHGLLWDIPVFGVFTPLLNAFWPNLGSGRATDGAATFTITNSVVRSDNLELNSPLMRMQYRGSVDFAGNLAARVEAEPLRDTWFIGPVVSTVLRPLSKVLEFKVTGNLDQPKAEPVYIPKIFLLPFTPVQSIRELFAPKPAATNAPPK